MIEGSRKEFLERMCVEVSEEDVHGEHSPTDLV